MNRRLATLLSAAAFMILSACASSTTIAESAPVEETAPVDETAPIDEAEAVDEPLVDEGFDCSVEALGADDDFNFVAAYVNIDGDLGEPCFGSPNSTLEAAWAELSIITPEDQLADLAVFAGFVDSGEGDEVTLAFVNSIDDDGLDFQMSVNLTSYEEDLDEARLTLAHEFAHVFTLLESEVDRSIFDPDECDTYYSSEGCFYEDSVMAGWIETFWGDGLIDEIDPFGDPSNAAGEDRCDANPGFFGPYAASDPEEDFAEAFSAYVYQLEPDTAAQQIRLDWIDAQPGLAEFRQRAVDAGIGPIGNYFEICG